MTKVLIATDKPFAPVAVQGIRKVVEEAGFELVLLESYTKQEDFIKAVENVDAVIVRSDKTDKSVIDAGKALKIIIRAGAGYDNIDLQAASSKGVCVMNTPGQNSNAVAELALGMMVYYVRNFYNGKSGTELKDKKLGIHAYGAVGKNVGRIAKGFGMEVYAYDPYISKEDIEKDGVKCMGSAEELYSTCNFISLHIPANNKTKESINYSLLSRMPTPAVLVNTARAEVIHEADLLRIFEEKKGFVYLSDVEPANKAEFEAKFKGRYFFTPKKMGAQTEEANINSGIAAAKQIVNFLKKGDRTFQVNK